MKITNNTTIDELFKIAVQSSKDVQLEKSFIVKDLFRGIDWNCLSLSIRNKLGRKFLEHIEENNDFIPDGKTLKNQQKYKKL